MEALPEISLIVPVHNQSDWLARCFSSIEAQTFSGFEVLLVDDGSTDVSAQMCKEWASGRARVRVLTHEECRGLSAARNTGIAAARGTWLAFLDSDDWVEPTFLESLYSAATSNSDVQVAQVEYAECFDEASLTQPAQLTLRCISGLKAAKDMLCADKYAVWCRLYDAQLVRSLGEQPFVEGLTCEDRIFNMRLLPKAAHVVQSNRVEYHYFQNKGSLSLGGLTKRGLDLLKADNLMVAAACATGDVELEKLARDRQAKGAYSLLVKHARFGVCDEALSGKAGQQTLVMLRERYVADYPRLMKSDLPASKKVIAWELRHAPALARAEFAVYNTLSGVGRQ